jgi:hypothetical protein
MEAAQAPMRLQSKAILSVNLLLDNTMRPWGDYLPWDLCAETDEFIITNL